MASANATISIHPLSFLFFPYFLSGKKANWYPNNAPNFNNRSRFITCKCPKQYSWFFEHASYLFTYCFRNFAYWRKGNSIPINFIYIEKGTLFLHVFEAKNETERGTFLEFKIHHSKCNTTANGIFKFGNEKYFLLFDHQKKFVEALKRWENIPEKAQVKVV